jgi:hypothetical protein
MDVSAGIRNSSTVGWRIDGRHWFESRRGRCDSPHQGAGPQMILAVFDHALAADYT